MNARSALNPAALPGEGAAGAVLNLHQELSKVLSRVPHPAEALLQLSPKFLYISAQNLQTPMVFQPVFAHFRFSSLRLHHKAGILNAKNGVRPVLPRRGPNVAALRVQRRRAPC